MDVVDAISALETDARDRPREDVVIERVDVALRARAAEERQDAPEDDEQRTDALQSSAIAVVLSKM